MRNHRKKLRLLLLYTSVGPYGTGHGGGVEPLFRGLLKDLTRQGHTVLGLVGKGSRRERGLALREIPGSFAVYQQSFSFKDPICLTADTFLENAWLEVKRVENKWDAVLSFSYDWISYYSSLLLKIPTFHYVSMGSLNESINHLLKKVSQCPHTFLGAASRAQVKTFPRGLKFEILGNYIDLTQYTFGNKPSAALGWAGRISKEKGLEDAFALAEKVGFELRVFGFMQDPRYFETVIKNYPNAKFKYYGQLSTAKLSRALGKCRALLMTPKWEEAFGLVALDALASGTPVLGYARGGIREIISEGKTGYLIPSDDLDYFAKKIEKIGNLSRKKCRQEAEQRFAFPQFSENILAWIRKR